MMDSCGVLTTLFFTILSCTPYLAALPRTTPCEYLVTSAHKVRIRNQCATALGIQPSLCASKSRGRSIYIYIYIYIY